MIEEARLERNRTLLPQCHPSFRTALAAVIAELEALGFRPRIQEAWRSPADELAAYQAGRSHVRFGFHNCTAVDGTPEALAADVLDDDHPLAAARPFLIALARLARTHGLTTGIDWGLPAQLRLGLDQAIAGAAEWTGKIGWDPDHVETTAVTIEQAHAGVRPASVPTATA